MSLGSTVYSSSASIYLYIENKCWYLGSSRMVWLKNELCLSSLCLLYTPWLMNWRESQMLLCIVWSYKSAGRILLKMHYTHWVGFKGALGFKWFLRSEEVPSNYPGSVLSKNGSLLATLFVQKNKTPKK